jgi:predicted CxxxxCH...CXXCH cytochrome family protein
MSFADWQTNCTFCHGEQTVAYAGGANPVKAAPPQDVAGSSATSSVGVGAHQRHLSSAIVAGGLACDACHVVPADLAHVKGQPAALTFSTFSGGAAASFDAASARCSNVYCHGATLGGGSAPAPKWTVVDGSQSTCGSCHGAPPASPHPASTITGCESCHAVSVDAQGNVLAGGKHLDGNVDATSPHPGGWASPTQHGYAAEASATSLAGCASCHAHQGYTSCTACHGGAGFSDWQTNCTFCHGTQTTAYAGGANPVKAAPPEGVHGEQLASDAHVGAHQRHLAATTYADPIACGTCHAVPADLSHITGTPATAFSGVAAGSTWNGTTCATYCHGATLPTGSGGGGTNETPSWTQSGVACNWCHSTSPTTGRHPAAFAKHGSLTCATCHGTGYSSTAVVRATHVNGTVEKAAFLNWNATNRTCSPGCHGTLSW